MYGLHNSLQATSGKGKELADILLRAAEEVSKVEGCKAYLVSIDTGDPDRIWVTEFWNRKEDHDASLQLPEVKSLIGKAMPILDGMPVGGPEIRLVGGYGLD